MVILKVALSLVWLVNEVKDDRETFTHNVTNEEVRQHSYKYRKRTALHWQAMRHQEPVTVSMQRHRNTKTASVHFTHIHIHTHIHSHTLFLGLGATILKAEGVQYVHLCPCQLARNWIGLGEDTGSLSSPQQHTRGWQGTLELKDSQKLTMLWQCKCSSSRREISIDIILFSSPAALFSLDQHSTCSFVLK